MPEFIKVSAGTAFLLTIVLVPVIILSALILYLTAEKSHGQKTEGAYITLLAYQQDAEIKGKSIVVDEVIINCQKEAKRCQEVEGAIATSSCSEASKNPRILFTSNQGGRAMIAADCPAYASPEKVFLRSEA